MLTEKYLAGLIDADGSFGVRYFRRSQGDFRPAMFLQVSQKATKNRILYLLQESFGGAVHTVDTTTGFGGSATSVWSVPHTEAMKLLYRLDKYMVVKRGRAPLMIDYIHNNRRVTEDRLEAHRAQLDVLRRFSHKLPNYPSRKWMAGYFDGDGCFASRIDKKSGYTYLSLRVTAHKDDANGVLLLHKAFGGLINYSKGENLPCWVLHLPPSKALQVVGHFANNAVIKRAEAFFVRGCAKGGNYRDGSAIHEALRHLKAQEQRLNDRDVDAAQYLSKVDFDVEDGRGKYPRKR
jgi:hypothetical protein